jgi:hypothetical protein
MEDFTEFAEARKAAKHQTIQSSATEQTGFIASRLNRDNFWNLMFAFMLFLGWSALLAAPQSFGSIIFWLSFIGAVVLVKHNSYLIFDKKKLEFTTSSGAKIKKSGLLFIILIVASFIVSGILGMTITGTENIEDSFFTQILIALLAALIPSLYCILRNFPIAVYFKKEAWIGDGSNNSYRPGGYKGHESNRTFSKRNTRDIIGSPAYRYMSCNIHNR